MRFVSRIFLATAAVVVMAGAARAHFIWLVTEPAEQPTTVKLYFGEEAGPDDPDLLDRVASAEAWIVGGRRSDPKPLTFKKDGDALVAGVPEGTAAAPVVLRHTYGVISRGEEPFLLKYYSKALPSALPGSWTAIEDQERLPLEIVARPEGSSMAFEVRWEGAPVRGATVGRPDGANWEFVGQLTHPRFFHRVLPATDQELVIVGGAHMSVGKILVLERLPVATVLAAQ